MKQGGGGAEKKFLVRHTALFSQATPGRRGGGVRKFFLDTHIQNFHEMRMFLTEELVCCIESKHDK